jgi:hypothetical protein
MRTLTLTLPDAATEAAFFEWLALHPQAVADGDTNNAPAKLPADFLADIQTAIAQCERGEIYTPEEVHTYVWGDLA